MREIIFRAKRKDNSEWVEGYLFDNGMPEKRYFVGGLTIEPYTGTACDDWDITGIDFYEIYPETICQYTGLKDKNGQKIFENDILDCGMNLRVSWHTFKASWVLSKKGWLYNHYFGESVEPEDVEVVGNIFDNPEL